MNWKEFIIGIGILFSLVWFFQYIESKISKLTYYKIKIFVAAVVFSGVTYTFIDDSIIQLTSEHKVCGVLKLLEKGDFQMGIVFLIVSIFLIVYGFKVNSTENKNIYED